MGITFSPESGTITVNESQDFTQTVVCTDDTDTAPPDLLPEEGWESPTVLPVIIVSVQTNFAEVVFSDNTFTINGPITGVFEKMLEYLDATNSPQMVLEFEDIAEDFNSLFKYVAPSITTKSVFITINFRHHGTHQYEIIVNFDRDIANTKLVENVKKGKF